MLGILVASFVNNVYIFVVTVPRFEELSERDESIINVITAR